MHSWHIKYTKIRNSLLVNVYSSFKESHYNTVQTYISQNNKQFKNKYIFEVKSTFRTLEVKFRLGWKYTTFWKRWNKNWHPSIKKNDNIFRWALYNLSNRTKDRIRLNGGEVPLFLNVCMWLYTIYGHNEPRFISADIYMYKIVYTFFWTEITMITTDGKGASYRQKRFSYITPSKWYANV